MIYSPFSPIPLQPYYGETPGQSTPGFSTVVNTNNPLYFPSPGDRSSSFENTSKFSPFLEAKPQEFDTEDPWLEEEEAEMAGILKDDSWKLGRAGGEGFARYMQASAVHVPLRFKGIDTTALPISTALNAIHFTIVPDSPPDNDFHLAKPALPTALCMAIATYCSAQNRTASLPMLLQRLLVKADLLGLRLGNYDVMQMHCMAVIAYYADPAKADPNEWPAAWVATTSRSAQPLTISTPGTNRSALGNPVQVVAADGVVDFAAMRRAAKDAENTTSIQVQPLQEQLRPLQDVDSICEHADPFNLKQQGWKTKSIGEGFTKLLTPSLSEADRAWAGIPILSVLPPSLKKGLVMYLQELAKPGAQEPSWLNLWFAVCRPAYDKPSPQEHKWLANPGHLEAGETVSQFKARLDRLGALGEAGWGDRDKLRYFQQGLRREEKLQKLVMEAERTLELRDGAVEYLKLYQETERLHEMMQRDCSQYAAGRQDVMLRRALEQQWGEVAVEVQLRELGIGTRRPPAPPAVTVPVRVAKPTYQPRATAAVAELQDYEEHADGRYDPRYEPAAAAPAAVCSACGRNHGGRCFFLHPEAVKHLWRPSPHHPLYTQLLTLIAERPLHERQQMLEKIRLPQEDDTALRGQQQQGGNRGKQLQQGGNRGQQQQQGGNRGRQQQQQQQQRQQGEAQQAMAAMANVGQGQLAIAQLPVRRIAHMAGHNNSQHNRPAAYAAYAWEDVAAAPAALMAYLEPEQEEQPAAYLGEAELVGSAAWVTRGAAMRARQDQQELARTPEIQEETAEPAVEPEEPEPAGESAPPPQGQARLLPFLPVPLGEGPVPPRQGPAARRRNPTGAPRLEPGTSPSLPGMGGLPILSALPSPAEAVVQLPLGELVSMDPEGAVSGLLKYVSRVSVVHGTGQQTQHPAEALLLVIPLKEYQRLQRLIMQQGTGLAAGASAAAQVRDALSRWSRAMQPSKGGYIHALLENKPTIFRVESRQGATDEEVMQGVSLICGGTMVGIDAAGVDTCCNMLVMPLELAERLQTGVNPSSTRVSQANGQNEPVVGVPAKQISIVLGYGTVHEVRLPLHQVYIHQHVGAGVKILIGTEVLNKTVSVIDLRPPGPRWRYHTSVSATGELGSEGSLPLTVYHPTIPLTVGLAAEAVAAPQDRDGPTCMVSSVGSAAEEEASLYQGRAGLATSANHPTLFPSAPGTEDELQEAYHRGELRPDLTRTGKPPLWEDVEDRLVRLMHSTEYLRHPLRPALLAPSSSHSLFDSWKPAPLPDGSWVDWDDTPVPPREPGFHFPLHFRLDLRWQVACRAVMAPTTRSLYFAELTRQEYEADDQAAWRYIMYRLYTEAFRTFVHQHHARADLRSLEICSELEEDDPMDATLQLLLEGHRQTGIRPGSVTELGGEAARQLYGVRGLGWEIREDGIPYWGGMGMQSPDFFLPWEERVVRDRALAVGWVTEKEIRDTIHERLMYTAVQNAMYGGRSPALRVRQAAWEGVMTLQDRVALKQEVKYHMAHDRWAGELLQRAQVDVHRLQRYLFHIDGEQFKQPPSDFWAMGYMEQGGENPSPPDNYFWLAREKQHCRIAGSPEEWQWSFDCTKEDADAPLCVAVTAAMQEPRRWAWVQKQEPGLLFEGRWDQQNEVQTRAAYLRQLYLTAWRLRTDHGQLLFKTPTLSSVLRTPAPTEARSEEWLTPVSVTAWVQQAGGELEVDGGLGTRGSRATSVATTTSPHQLNAQRAMELAAEMQQLSLRFEQISQEQKQLTAAANQPSTSSRQ